MIVMRHVTIRGLVQGVGFRAWTERQATARNLEGWVRNRHDGSVEAVFAGSQVSVTDMIALCRSGPIAARVETVLEEAVDPEALTLRAGKRFAQLPTL